MSALAAADFDGDGAMDLAAANVLSGRISLLTPAGTGISALSLGRTHAPTLLLPLDADGDGRMDVVSVDVDGEQARVFSGVSSAAPRAAEVRDILAWWEQTGRAAMSSSVSSRLAKLAGDGLVTRFATAAEPLMLEVRDQTGAPVAGAGVVFSRVAGEARLPGATESEAVAATTSRDAR